MLGLPLPPGAGAVGSAGAGGSGGGAAGGSGGGGLDMTQVCKDLCKLLVCLLLSTPDPRTHQTRRPVMDRQRRMRASAQRVSALVHAWAAAALCLARRNSCVFSHLGCTCSASSRRQTSTKPLLIERRTAEEARQRAEAVAAVRAAAVRVPGGRPQRTAVRVAGRMAPPRSVRTRPMMTRIAKCST